MAHILVVGKAFSGIKKYMTDHGHEYTILQDQLATKYPGKKLKNRVVVDLLDEKNTLKVVDKINSKKKIDATFVTYESYIVINSVIAKHLKLPGLTRKSAEACTDKELMRTLFSQAPEKISPDFAVAESREAVIEFAYTHNFPLILKPANLAKSLLVTKNSNLEELLSNYDKATNLMESTYAKYAPGRTPKLIIEEYLDGHIHSVDAFVDSHGEPHVLENVVDYQTGYDIGYEDNFHYSRLLPSRLSRSEIQKIRHTAAVGCKALGITSSPAHVEIIYTRDGPRIVEIGARNGGYRERMHWLANGIDITGNALAVAMNMPLSIKPTKQDSVGVFELFPKKPGYFQGISNENLLKNLTSLQYADIKAKEGQYIGKSSDGYKMTAVVILANASPEVFNEDLTILRTVTVETS